MAVPETDCWLHPDVEVRRSPIAGRGLFARRRINAGSIVSRLGGHLVSLLELRDLIAVAERDPAGSYVDTIAVDEDVHLVLPPRRDNGFGNHSCDPNLWWVDAYTLAARRDIGADEEITSDYATSTGDEAFTMICRCASPLCRQLVTGQDWRILGLQLRYGEHWVPVLAARIRGVVTPVCGADA